MAGLNKISICGLGGQGIILSAVMLGTTAVTKEGQFAVQTQSYGSEARGGQCQAELILSDSPILSPMAEKKNILIALFQDAYERYIPSLERDGVLIYDPDLTTSLTFQPPRTFQLPCTQIAVDLGNRMAANMVVLGFASACLGLVQPENLAQVIRETVSPRFLDLDLKAMQAGVDYALAHGARC